MNENEKIAELEKIISSLKDEMKANENKSEIDKGISSIKEAHPSSVAECCRGRHFVSRVLLFFSHYY